MEKKVIINVEIDKKKYPVSCNVGEEKRLEKCAQIVTEVLSGLKNDDITVSDNRMLIMTCLILAQYLHPFRE